MAALKSLETAHLLMFFGIVWSYIITPMTSDYNRLWQHLRLCMVWNSHGNCMWVYLFLWYSCEAQLLHVLKLLNL
jgi:hypothetical protein